MSANIGILLYEKVQPMDVIGPWEVLSFWKNNLNAPINLYLVAEKEELVHCSDNIVLKAHCDFTNAPLFDYLIVPGGSGRLKQVNNEVLISFIKKQAQQAKYVISVCTGMFLLQKAGLLDKQKATTYWRALPELKGFPKIKVSGQRIVKNKKIWTAGGVSSGIDLAFELIATIAGRKIAGQVQLLFEYFPRTTQYSTPAMIYSLPPYHEHAVEKPYLPEYILKYMNKKKKKAKSKKRK